MENDFRIAERMNMKLTSNELSRLNQKFWQDNQWLLDVVANITIDRLEYDNTEQVFLEYVVTIRRNPSLDAVENANNMQELLNRLKPLSEDSQYGFEKYEINDKGLQFSVLYIAK